MRLWSWLRDETPKSFEQDLELLIDRWAARLPMVDIGTTLRERGKQLAKSGTDKGRP